MNKRPQFVIFFAQLLLVFLALGLMVYYVRSPQAASKETIVRTPYQCEKLLYFEISWRTPCPFGDLEPLQVKLPMPCRFADELKVGDDILRRSNIEANPASRHWRMELIQK